MSSAMDVGIPQPCIRGAWMGNHVGVIYRYLSLSISIRPPWPLSMLNIGWWCSTPKAEDKGSLGSVPNVLNVATVFPPYSVLSSHPTPPSPPSLVSSLYPTSSSISCSLLKSRLTCSDHRLGTCYPGLQSASRHRSRIGRVAMYCAAVFWNMVMYVSIFFSPSSYM